MADAHDRSIRVFISSTFRDMQAERDELVKRVFPRLRKLCESRGVAWSEVDLRWGVTDEDRAEGRVLPICLAEIQQCRPYFIGLLGERYGWIPEEIPPAWIQQEPWLADCRDRSVTELEILHGVLNDPSMVGHAYFYLRAPTTVEGSSPEPETSRRKLEALKDRLRSSRHPRREGFRDASELGTWVLADLTALINRLYPEGERPGFLERTRRAHEMVARSRAGVYIPRPELYARLDAHDAGPLVVVGESGFGKSALLANWARRTRSHHPSERVIEHYVGADAGGGWAPMLRRLIRELHPEADVPHGAVELRAAFADSLIRAGRVVLILDGLDRLEDAEGALDLVWLPPVVPPGVRLILSTAGGRTQQVLSSRGWPRLTVGPMEPDHRRRLVVETLARHRKALSGAQVDRLVASEAARNPLYLCILLDELRQHGVHETLDECITSYLRAPTVTDLFQRVLERCEGDFDRDRPGLVRDAFSLVWAARAGLSEPELMDLLGQDGVPLRRSLWSPVWLALEHSLLMSTGLIGFGHDTFRTAVERRYLPGAAAHRRLAEYFRAQEPGPRRVHELPWQWVRLEDWMELASLMSDLDFAQAAWEADRDDVLTYWTRIEAHSDRRMLDAYRPALADPGLCVQHFSLFQPLLYGTGHWEAADRFAQTILDGGDALGLDAAQIANLHNNQAACRAKLGRLDEAMASFQEVERVLRKLGDAAGAAWAAYNRAGILRSRGDLDGSMALMEEHERFCRSSGDRRGLRMALSGQVTILGERRDTDRAMAVLTEVEQLCREQGDTNGLRNCLGQQGATLTQAGDPNGALKLHEQEESLCRQVGDRPGLMACLKAQGEALAALGRLEEADDRLLEAERIARDIGSKGGLLRALGQRAMILRDTGRLEECMTVLRERAGLCREMQDPAVLQETLGLLAMGLGQLGQTAEALKIETENERLCRSLGRKEALNHSLGNQAWMIGEAGDEEGAIVLYREQEGLCRELGDQRLLRANLESQGKLLGNRALAAARRGDVTAALDLVRAAERKFREIENEPGIQLCEKVQGILAAIDSIERREVPARADTPAPRSLFRRLAQFWRRLVR